MGKWNNYWFQFQELIIFDFDEEVITQFWSWNADKKKHCLALKIFNIRIIQLIDINGTDSFHKGNLKYNSN